MKITFFLLIAWGLLCITAIGQSSGLPQPDKSPMDMSYYPANYPVLKIQDKIKENPILRVIYSRPQKAGRAVFGELVEYGNVWRMGANEATEIEFFKNVRIGGKKITKGRYTLYAIVRENNWTLILNKETDTWGAFKYEPKKDMVRIDVTAQKMDDTIEFFSIVTEATMNGCNIIIAWDKTKIALPVNF